MTELSARERGYVTRLQTTQRLVIILGVVLAFLGAAYISWAIYLFDWRVDPREQASFDRPVARLAFMFDGYQKTIDKIKPETSVEGLLLDSMQGGMRFSAGIVIMLMRIYLGTLVLLMGLIALTVVVERRRLLVMIEKLQA